MTMKQLTVEATLENLVPVQAFIEGELEAHGCSMGDILQISIAVEEIYVNIAHYAYHPEVGHATILCEIAENPLRLTLQFLDNGKAFNPLAKKDADITLSAEERDIGGLGIFLVKKNMDHVAYRYEDGKNILVMKKSYDAD